MAYSFLPVDMCITLCGFRLGFGPRSAGGTPRISPKKNPHFRSPVAHLQAACPKCPPISSIILERFRGQIGVFSGSEFRALPGMRNLLTGWCVLAYVYCRTTKWNGEMILDPCCGTRMMWSDRENPDVIFGDIRRETVVVADRSHGNESGTRTLRIEPDALMDFRALPFPDSSFRLVAFDPPHLVRAGSRSWLAAKYGKLSDNWRDDLRSGFAECFRVLDADGVLVFKWNETQVKVREVLSLAPAQPLFGHLSGRKGLTHWLVFMKQTGQHLRE